MFISKNLEKFRKIRHCFFSRKNGYSSGIYRSLNCGKGSKDEKINIVKNLKFVSEKMGTKIENLILMNQTHSNKVIIVNKSNIKNQKFNSDALVTKLRNITIGVLTADCVPIILYDKQNDIIGCIHAGWKGAISGVIENTIKAFKKINNKNSIIASIGPCIGKKSYEVKIDFYKTFLKESKSNIKFFLPKKNNSFLFDIREYVAAKLINNNVKKIDNINFDTYKDIDNFYSFRRSQKLGETDYGRCISTICLKT